MKAEMTAKNPYLYSAPKDPLTQGEGQKKGQGLLDPKLLQKSSPDYRVDLTATPSSPPSVSAPGLSTLSVVPELPNLPELKLPETPSDVAEAAKEDPKVEIKKPEKIEKEEAKEGSLKRPFISFIKGLDIFSTPLKSETGYAGLGRIAESVEGARLYGWDQKEEIIKEIKRTHPDYPVILVGHSFGGDTALDIARELDSLEHKFQGIDLLVTLDAVGFHSDIIPQNVKKHLNVFGEKSFFLNGSPHVARREEKTEVRNILSPLDHTDIDDDREIQYEVVGMIQKALSSKGKA